MNPFVSSKLHLTSLGFIALFVNIATCQYNLTDTTFIESFADKFNVKVNLENKGESYRIEGIQLGGPAELKTNNTYYIGASLDFQILGLSVAFSPSFLPGNDDAALKGESSFFEINPRLAFKKWLQTIQYRRVEGYYIDNTEDFIPDWSEGEDPYIQIENSSSTTFGMSTSFIVNPNFSYKHILYQTEWQKRNEGSLIPRFDYNYNDYNLPIDDIVYKDTSFDLSLALAYYYTFVIHENWFIAPNIAPSVGVSFAKLKTTTSTETITEKTNYFKTALESGLQLGFSSKRIFFGLLLTSDFYWYDQPERVFIENNRFYGKLYFGYRFNSPGFIARPYSKFTKKVGI